MPSLDTAGFPLTNEVLQKVGARLTGPDDFEILDREGERLLFLRSRGSEPDPVADLERGLESVPSWVARGLSACLVLSPRGHVHIPAYQVLPLLHQRDQVDEELAARARAHLDVRYGHARLRAPSDASHVERLLVRVPRERVAEVSEVDLASLAETLGAELDQGHLQRIRSCLLVAQTDHLRIRPRDFLEDIGARWATRPPPPLAATPVALPPSPQAPRRVEVAEPAFEIETELVAVDDAETALRRLHAAQASLQALFESRGFHIEPNALVGGIHYSLLATRKSSYPRRVAVQSLVNFTRAAAEELLRASRAQAWDQAYAVTLHADPEGLRLTMATKVKVLSPDQVGQVVP